MSRAEFPEKVRVKRLHFAEFRCEGIVTRDDGTKTRCNATLARGRVEYDHDNPDGLTGEPTFENCRALCKVCHSEKTRLDKGNIARAVRQEAKFVGASKAESKLKAPSKPARVERERAPGGSEIARRYGL